jgi:hypothetical protein
VIILANRDFLVNSLGENILNLSDPLSSAKGSSHRTDRAEGVIMHISEESAATVRKTVKCHQGNRFFALCHIAAFPYSHKAFLCPL